LFGIRSWEHLQIVLWTQVAHGLDIARRDLEDIIGGIAACEGSSLGWGAGGGFQARRSS
jgi:hypothetical protein